MKRSQYIQVAVAAILCAVFVGAQAAGIDLHSLALQHSDAITGAGMLAFGSMDLVMKGIDNIEGKMQAGDRHLAELDDRLMLLEQKGGGDRSGGSSDRGDSLGDMVVKQFNENRELFDKTRSVRMSFKAASDPVTTSSGRRIVAAGVGGPTGSGVVGFQRALMQRPANGSSAVEYSRYTGYTGEAEVQATEGAAKAQLRPDHTLITQSAITVAGYSKMSRQALNDAQELKRSIEVTLNRSVSIVLDTAMVAGSVAPAFAGYQSLAYPWLLSTFTRLFDQISEVLANMQTEGFNPDVVIMAPQTYVREVCRTAGLDGEYLYPKALDALPGVQTVRGLRVVFSPGIALGAAIVMDSAHSELLICDDFSVEVAYSGDDFTKNLVTILGEVRVIPVFRTVASAFYINVPE